MAWMLDFRCRVTHPEAFMNTTSDTPQARPYCGGIGLLLVAVLLGGCGEFAYKRGATASDLAAAKNSCQASAPDPAAMEQCLADNGWVVQKLDRMEPLDADPVIEATALRSDRRIENPVSAAPGATQPASAVRRTPEMTDTFKVNSWWKIGSGAASLKADTDACVAKLGEAHRPNPETLSATRGLLLCMKDKGWSGLRAQ